MASVIPDIPLFQPYSPPPLPAPLYNVGLQFNGGTYQGDVDTNYNASGVGNWGNGVSAYYGMWSNGLRHGSGSETLYTSTGSVLNFYQGEWSNGQRHGRGIWRSELGDVYNATFQNGILTGPARVDFANGTTYEGLLENGLRHGLGLLTFNNGAKYHGYFAHGRISGRGKLTYPGGRVYDGHWTDSTRGCGDMTEPKVFYNQDWYLPELSGW